MSMMYCDSCDKQIDTDFNAEHFDECAKQEAEELAYSQRRRAVYELTGYWPNED